MPSCVPPAQAELIRRCTNSDPGARPSFEQIAAELAYASADAPTLAESALWRRREAAVVASLFPPRVAAALKEGRPVEPETFAATTVFFSDIVKFTEARSRCRARKSSLFYPPLLLCDR